MYYYRIIQNRYDVFGREVSILAPNLTSLSQARLMLLQFFNVYLCAYGSENVEFSKDSIFVRPDNRQQIYLHIAKFEK